MANISKIKLPNNDTAYDIKDTVSGYTTNTGTVTSVRVQATSPVQSSVSTAQSASLNTTISLANGYGDTKNPYASKTKNYVLAAPSTANGVPTFRALTAADIPDLSGSYLPITGGTVNGNTTIYGAENEVGLSIYNESISFVDEPRERNPIYYSSSTGTLALKYLATPTASTDAATKGYVDGLPVSTFNNDAGYITEADIPEGASAYTGTPSAVSTTAAKGTSNAFARGDHVHNITSSTITSALGYTPYNSTNPNGYITASQDTKLAIEEVNSTGGTTYYPIVGRGSTGDSNASIRQWDSNGFTYYSKPGTTSEDGVARLILGNIKSSGTANNKQGQLMLYGLNGKTHNISGTPTNTRNLILPDKSGTFALTSDIPNVPTTVNNHSADISIANHATGTVIGVQSTTTTASKVTVGSSSTDYGVTAAGSGSGSLTFTMDTTDTKKLKITFSHTHTAPTLGSKVPTVSATNVTVPIKNDDASTFVTETTHTITDEGHTHSLS